MSACRCKSFSFFLFMMIDDMITPLYFLNVITYIDQFYVIYFYLNLCSMSACLCVSLYFLSISDRNGILPQLVWLHPRSHLGFPLQDGVSVAVSTIDFARLIALCQQLNHLLILLSLECLLLIRITRK